MAGPPLRFDPETAPWLDRVWAEIDAYVENLGDRAPADYDLRATLVQWVRDGYLVFEQLADPALVDAYLADLDELFERRERHGVLVNAEGAGVKPIRDHDAADLHNRHMRVMDFHNASRAGKRLALHPRIVEVLGHLFRDEVIAMQTLTFIHGTEQWLHQDFPYVVAEIPSHLAASWIALEDSHADAGPLGYRPGSHTIPKFDWGDGMLFTESSSHDEIAFRDHLERECDRAGLSERLFPARKGDVFLWHAALAHRGSQAKNPELTRRSLVTHYSSRSAYTRDRRAPRRGPKPERLNGGWLYRNPALPGEEDVFTRGDAV